jgi:hypothetical protein
LGKKNLRIHEQTSMACNPQGRFYVSQIDNRKKGGSMSEKGSRRWHERVEGYRRLVDYHGRQEQEPAMN